MSETTTEYVTKVHYKVNGATRYFAVEEAVELRCEWRRASRSVDPCDRDDDKLLSVAFVWDYERLEVIESFRMYYSDCKSITDGEIIDAFTDAVHTIIEERGMR